MNVESTQKIDSAMTSPGQAGSTLKITASRTLMSLTNPVARRAKCGCRHRCLPYAFHHQGSLLVRDS